jgi:hypothetical protein
MTREMMEFEDGQVWKYVTRPGEEKSLLLVGAVGGGRVHFALAGLSVKVPDPRSALGPKLPAPFVGHVCLTEEAFAASVTELVDPSTPEGMDDLTFAMMASKLRDGMHARDLFEEGFTQWEKESGKPFDKGVASVIEEMEQAMNDPAVARTGALIWRLD